MASLASPIGPTITVAARTVSRSVISGGGGGGGGDPQTSAIVVRQSNTIVQLQKEVGTLRKSQSESIVAFQKELGNIQTNLQTIAVNVRDLGNSFKQNNKLLVTDAELGRKQQIQEQLQETKLTEEGVRAGKESQLEQKLQNAILAPIRVVTAQAQSIFAKLQEALSIFLLGWLTTNILDMFRADSQNNQNLLQQIFNTIVSSITAVFKGLQVINKTFRGIIGIVTGVTKLLAKFLVSGVGLLFKGLGAIANGIVAAGKGIASGATSIISKVTGTQAAETAATATAKAVGTEASQAAGKQIAKEGAETAGKSLFKKFPGVSLLAGGAFGIERLYAGDPFGASLEFASGIAGTFAGPGTAVSLLIDAYSLKRRVGQVTEQGDKTKAAKEKAFNEPSAAAPAPAPAKPASTATPSTPMMPSSAELSFDPGKMKYVPEGMDFSTPAEFGEVAAPVESGGTGQSQPASITPAQTQSVPSAAAKVGPEPEAKPNVIMMSSVPGAQGRPDTVLASQPGAASDVPSIDSSNPDNFYALYSQVNYNVVM